MSSRQRILDAIRAAQPAPSGPLAETIVPSTVLDSPALAERCIAAVTTAGGACLRGADAAAARYQADGAAGPVWSDLEPGSCPLSYTEGPAVMAGLDLGIVHGAFGVSENGAVWVPVPAGAHRSHLFLTQRLVLVVHTAQLVPDMHAAYARLASHPLPPYGVFIAGPSKTADIEQTLVLGAHGPCELTVLLVDGI